VCVFVELKENALQFLVTPNDVPKSEWNKDDKNTGAGDIMQILSFILYLAQTRSLNHYGLVSVY
jgi:hypothetical protein